jgi:glycyl-tRNA synthetase beta subunit
MNSKKYLEGRLSACQEIIPTAVNPAVAERLTCMIKGNDVVVRLKLDDGEVFFSLDGKKKD